MKKKKLSDYMEPASEKIAVSAMLPKDLHAIVKAELKKDGHTVNELILAAFKSYLEEKKSGHGASRSKE